MAPVPVELEIRPPAEEDEDEVVLIADFDQFAEAQTGLACSDDVPYR
jgi:hypothetical protein